MSESMGKKFRTLVYEDPPLQVVGAVNAFSAMLAEKAGCKAIYLSGAGVSNASYGLPDLGMTSLAEVLEDVRRITQACSLPMLVDADTGWGQSFSIARTVKLMEHAQVAAIHIEDQGSAKRCGHRPNKSIVSMVEMGDRIKSAVDARLDDNFVIMARTDAFASEGLSGAMDRAQFYIDTGADMIFAEALSSLSDYKEFSRNIQAPVLANITEFGKTPIFTRSELKAAGVKLILYPLSAFRSMSKSALNTYCAIIKDGSQKEVLSTMQTRNELYDVLKYCEYEKKLDQLKGVMDE